MPKFVNNYSIELNGEVAAVFDYLVNVRHHLEWGQWDGELGLESLHIEGDEPIQVGSRFHSTGKERHMGLNFGYKDVSTVTVLEAPHKFCFQTKSWTFPFQYLNVRHCYETKATDDGTLIKYSIQIEPGNLSAWLNWPIDVLFAKLDENLLQRNLERLKESFEVSSS